MVIKENEITGMIRGQGVTLDVNPLRNTSFHTLQEIDPSKFEKELAPLRVEDIENEPKQKEVKQKSTTPTINVLVAYTTDAKNNHSGDIESSIVLAEGNMDNSFSNSDINADVEVVHTMEVSYSATSDSDLNLCRLTTSDSFDPRPTSIDCDPYSTAQLSGYMQIIHEKRYEHDAQVVVLVTDAGGPGIGWTRVPNAQYAFSVAREDRFVSTYTMAHEIGHNIGNQHNKDADENPFYPYGHGYNYNPSDWSTIMAYPPTGSSRINHFSNPNETFAGEATGTVADEDNARVWDNRAGTVSNFDPPAPPPVVTISGTTLMDEGENETWNSTIVDGEAPYTYEWKRIVLGQGGTGTVVSTSTSYSGVQNESFDLILTVSDFFNESDTDRIFVTVEDGGGCQPGFPCKVVGENLPTEFGLSDNYPNPFNPSTQIKFELPEKAEVSIEVYNIMGQKVATLINNQLQAGFHNTTFKADNLSSGVYIARLQAIGNSGERFVQEIKMQLIK